MDQHDFDVFISYAWEDKADFVEPLANELRRLGLKTWFDKFSLKVGDSLRESIESGLARSRYGIVVFSPNFLSKNWPKAELNGLFSREMAGKKVIILPVWHNISSAEMNAILPIQADKVALRSSDGVEAVAKALVDVVRPDLLNLDVQKGFAFDTAGTFVKLAKAQYPGYDFAVHSGASGHAVQPGTVASVTNGMHRIDILVTNPTLIRERPNFKFMFTGQGAEKAQEFYRTGKAQSWEPGEFEAFMENLPLMPAYFGPKEQSVLTVQPNLSHIPARQVRLEIGSSTPMVFPVMQMCPTRLGAAEGEAVISRTDTPLKIALVFSKTETRTVDCTLSWNFVGFYFSQCQRAIEAIDRLRKGDILRIRDLETDRALLESAEFAKLDDDAIPSQFRSLVSLATQIEKHFSATLKYTGQISEEDSESLFYLDCLLNGRVYGTDLKAKFTITKGDGELGASQRHFISGEPMTFFQAPNNYPGYFSLFGKQILAPSWGLYTERCKSEATPSEVTAFDQLQVGDSFLVKFSAETATHVRWRESCKVDLSTVPQSARC